MLEVDGAAPEGGGWLNTVSDPEGAILKAN